MMDQLLWFLWQVLIVLWLSIRVAEYSYAYYHKWFR